MIDLMERIVERIVAVVAQLIGIMLVPVGAFIAADSADVERWIGGGIVTIAGVFLVRWALKTSERVEATYVQALNAANTRANECEERALRYRTERDTVQAALDQERKLRMELEQLGLTDRRQHLRPEEG